MRILLSSSAALISTLLLINPSFASAPEAADVPPPATPPAQGEAPSAQPGQGGPASPAAGQALKAEDIVSEDAFRAVVNPDVVLPFIARQDKDIVLSIILTEEVSKFVLDNNVLALRKLFVVGDGVAAEVLNSSLSKLGIDPPTIAHVKLLTDPGASDRFYAAAKELASNPRYSPLFEKVSVNPPSNRGETPPLIPILVKSDGSGSNVFLPPEVVKANSELLAKTEKMNQVLAALDALGRAKQEEIGADLPKLVQLEELNKQMADIEEARAKFLADNKSTADAALAKVEQAKKDVQTADAAVKAAEAGAASARNASQKNQAAAAVSAAQTALKAKQDALAAAERESSALTGPLGEFDAQTAKFKKDIDGLGDVREILYAAKSYEKKAEVVIKSQMIPLLSPK
jgi:hypothetical protein